jgi:2-aminoadipate transaminase
MDATYLQRFLSDSARKATRSEIRELLKLLARPDVISLAGGLPAPDTFPTEELAELAPSLFREHGKSALQYCATEGDAGLRDELIKLMADDGVPDLTPDQVLVSTASQQGLDLSSRVFLSPGDTVICGLPSYLGALGAFSACGARLSGVPLDDDGMRTDLLEQRLVDLRRGDVRPKMVYVVPDFQNPAGVTLTLERRRELLEIASEFDLLVIEDSPYRHLRYVGSGIPNLASLDREGRVISLFTFSKILFPGLRLGWVVANPEIIARLVTAKQPVDLCTSSLGQVLAREYLRTGRLPAQVERTRRYYSRKRAAMLDALDRHIDSAWGVRWTRPAGGMFVWMTLPRWMNARRLLDRSLRENVAFVCGNAFHCDGSGSETLRLNFSYPTLEQFDLAIERLARAIGALVEEGPVEQAPGRGVEPMSAPLMSGDHSLDQLSLTLALTEVVV